MANILQIIHQPTQLFKIGQLGGFLDFGSINKTGLPLTKNVLKSLAKSVLKLLGLTAAASATDAAIRKKIVGSGVTTIIIPDEEMDNIMKIFKSIEEYGLLKK